MSIPLPNPPVTKRDIKDEALTAVELKAFMDKHGISTKEMGSILGVSLQAVRLWLAGDRGISLTITRLIIMFEKYPQLIKDF
jgi:DNA-binding transcriptional regulator YiaG